MPPKTAPAAARRFVVALMSAFLLLVASASASVPSAEQQAGAVVKPLGPVREALSGKGAATAAIGTWGQRETDCIAGVLDSQPPPVEGSDLVFRVAGTLVVAEVGRRLVGLARSDWARAVRVWDELKTPDPQVKQVRKKAGTFIRLLLGLSRYEPCAQFETWADKSYDESRMPRGYGATAATHKAQKALSSAFEEGQVYFRCEDGFLMLSLQVTSC